MIEVTDEMVRLALDKFLSGPADNIQQIDERMREGLNAVFALVLPDLCLKPRGHVFRPLTRPARIPHCPVVDDLCPGDSRGVLCLTSCRGG